MSCSADSRSTVVAVPVWGSRILPRFGAARDFRFAEVERARGTIRWLGTRGWDPERDAGVASWLRMLGVGGVICCGIHQRFLFALEAENLWVCWGQRGEVEEVLQRWAMGEAGSADQRCGRFGRCSGRGARSRGDGA